MASTCRPLIILLIFGSVSCGRKGSSSKGDHPDPDPDPEVEPTETPTEYFYEVDNVEMLKNFSAVAATWDRASLSIETATDSGKGEECYGEPTLCTYCRNEVGNSTTDLQCRDRSRLVCWSSTGCYRMTFRDVSTGAYHIEKGCWYESFPGRFGTSNRECKKKKEGLSDPADREGCFFELCHGPMCNRDILLSGAGSLTSSTLLGMLCALAGLLTPLSGG